MSARAALGVAAGQYFSLFVLDRLGGAPGDR